MSTIASTTVSIAPAATARRRSSIDSSCTVAMRRAPTCSTRARWLGPDQRRAQRRDLVLGVAVRERPRREPAVGRVQPLEGAFHVLGLRVEQVLEADRRRGRPTRAGAGDDLLDRRAGGRVVGDDVGVAHADEPEHERGEHAGAVLARRAHEHERLRRARRSRRATRRSDASRRSRGDPGRSWRASATRCRRAASTVATGRTAGCGGCARPRPTACRAGSPGPRRRGAGRSRCGCRGCRRDGRCRRRPRARASRSGRACRCARARPASRARRGRGSSRIR